MTSHYHHRHIHLSRFLNFCSKPVPLLAVPPWWDDESEPELLAPPLQVGGEDQPLEWVKGWEEKISHAHMDAYGVHVPVALLVK